MEAGYLGVGAMGQPMAHKLLDAGHALTIYDINEAAMRPLLERQARRVGENSPTIEQGGGRTAITWRSEAAGGLVILIDGFCPRSGHRPFVGYGTWVLGQLDPA
jgi:hypothetical protein